MGWDDDSNDETVDLEVKLIRVSKAASLLSRDGDEQWVPHSLIQGGDIDCEDEDHVGRTGNVTISEWKAEELGWA